MITSLTNFALLVKDYDEALAFYCGKLGFKLLEDTHFPDKRWVRIQAPGGGGSDILLSRVTNGDYSQVGNQAAGRVLFFLTTDDFLSDYQKLKNLGVIFCEEPRFESYGSVAVMQDLYGNRIDLIQPK